MKREWLEHLLVRYDRRLQLLRGQLLRLRGATAGTRFGVGRHVQVWHPDCLVLGHDVTILDFAYIRSAFRGSVQAGDHTAFHIGFWLDCGSAHDPPGFFHVGSHCLIQPYGVMNAGGGITIGDHVLMGQMVTIHAGNHRFDDPTRRIDEQGTVHEGVTIEDDCWIGAKATILDGVRIGHGAVIGAGAVVTHSVAPYAVAVGVPARVIKQRDVAKR
jgi:acetyltransferase-like isoleucine patch superfamily enzyme